VCQKAAGIRRSSDTQAVRHACGRIQEAAAQCLKAPFILCLSELAIVAWLRHAMYHLKWEERIIHQRRRCDGCIGSRMKTVLTDVGRKKCG